MQSFVNAIRRSGASVLPLPLMFDLFAIAKFSPARRYASAVLAMSVAVCWPDCKPEGPLFSAEFVCLSVCVSDRHFYPSTLTDFDETSSVGHKDPTLI